MFWNKRSFRTMGFTWLALLLFTATALAGQKDLGESGGSAACERMIHLSEEAEKQLGGTLAGLYQSKARRLLPCPAWR